MATQSLSNRICLNVSLKKKEKEKKRNTRHAYSRLTLSCSIGRASAIVSDRGEALTWQTCKESFRIVSFSMSDIWQLAEKRAHGKIPSCAQWLMEMFVGVLTASHGQRLAKAVAASYGRKRRKASIRNTI